VGKAFIYGVVGGLWVAGEKESKKSKIFY